MTVISSASGKAVIPLIESGIPIPPPKKKGKNVGLRILWPFVEMQVGDSFSVPEWADAQRALATLCKLRREGRIDKSREFAVRELDGKERIWRIA